VSDVAFNVLMSQWW